MKRLAFAFVLLASAAAAQVAVVPYRSPHVTFTDATGIPLADGCVFFYQGGTSTPQATYTDSTGTTQNTNPVILDSTGSANIWFGPSAYKIVAWTNGGTNCATGTQQWSVDQVPGNSFTGSIGGATISSGTISGATITGGSINNTPTGTSTPNLGDFTSILASSINKTLYPAQCLTNVNYASWCISGGDIGQQINAAWASCSDACTVHLGPAAYTYATTISATSGSPSLICDAGATLQYTGTGDAIDLFNLTTSAQEIISGCSFSGTSSGAAGLHVKGSSTAGIFSGISISGFTSGDCLRNEGVQGAMYINPTLSGCLNGVHNIGQSAGVGANNLRFIGGSISNNSQYGIFEDASLRSSVGSNYKNTYQRILIQGNTTQIFFQGCTSCGLYGNTIEIFTTGTVPEQLLVGDASNSVIGLAVRDNYFWAPSATVTNVINLVNAASAIIDGNYESSSFTSTNFVNAAAASTNIFVKANFVGSTNYTAGAGTFAQICDGSGNCSVLATSFESVGAAAGIAGCSLSGAKGGSQAGQFTAGVTGACTVNISPGLTAKNGWRCAASDITSPANFTQSATATTTCTVSGSATSGDVITWSAVAY